MSAAAVGSEVRLYVDLLAQVEPGHAIQTQTGRTYLVLACRRQARGSHVGRQHLRCIVVDSPSSPGEWIAGPNLVIHRIRWYARGRRTAALKRDPRRRAPKPAD